MVCDSYPGMSLHLTDEAVSREAQFGNPCVPDVFHQRADFIGFGDIVRRTAKTHKPPCKTSKKKLTFFFFFFFKWASLVEQKFGQLHVERTGNRSEGMLSPLQVSHLLQLLWTSAIILQTITMVEQLRLQDWDAAILTLNVCQNE